MDRYVEVTTTTETEQDARRIATAVVQGRLAACAQVAGPITSTYWWDGEVQTAEEWRCQIKTTRGRLEELTQTILALHPYDTPEIIALPIVAGSEAYLSWLEEEVGEG